MKIICVGWNYRPHLKELDGPLPKEPLIFLKPSTCLIGNNDSIVIPEGITNVQYEGELALVFGKTGKNISENDALSYVSFVAAFNDVTARDMQNEDRKKGNSWDLAKGMDTFGPISELVSADGLNLQNLRIVTKVNGKTVQDANTKDMIFTIPQLITYVSKYMTIEKGDMMATGTPEGVGEIKRGDVVSVEIENIGKIENKVV